MTRFEIIKKLSEIKELLAWEDIGATYYAREKAYVDISAAIEALAENEDMEDENENEK